MKGKFDFWNIRQLNKESDMPGVENEQFIDEKNFSPSNVPGLLYDVKGQLIELNTTLATIGEMLGEYLDSLQGSDE